MSKIALMNPTDELFTDIAPEQAEVVEGGVGTSKVYKTRDALNAYQDSFFRKWLGAANTNRPILFNANNKISSVIIDRGIWDFYNGFNATGGKLLTLTPGLWAFVGDRANDRISSFYRRPGT